MSPSSPVLSSVLLLLLGLVGLWGGTQLTVQNSVRLARRFQVSDLFLGLTVLALGTDLPELLVAVDGALHTRAGVPSSGVVVGTAVGSAVGQGALVLGLSAMLHYLSVGRQQLKFLGVQLVASLVVFYLVAQDGVVTTVDGLLLLAVFVLYVTHMVTRRSIGVEEEPGESERRWYVEAGLVGLGLVLVLVASELTVDQAIHLSEIAGLQQSFVGAVIIALGTSTPELAISLRAISQGKTGLSVGNVVGSNIFDLLVPTGVAAVITPLLVDRTVIGFDLPYLLGITLLLIFFLARRRGLQKWEGASLLAAYVGYVAIRSFMAGA